MDSYARCVETVLEEATGRGCHVCCAAINLLTHEPLRHRSRMSPGVYLSIQPTILSSLWFPNGKELFFPCIIAKPGSNEEFYGVLKALLQGIMGTITFFFSFLALLSLQAHLLPCADSTPPGATVQICLAYSLSLISRISSASPVCSASEIGFQVKA